MKENRIQPQTLRIVSLLIFCVPLGGDTSPITCYNDHGKAVDWFYMYKLPKEPNRQSPHRGESYLLLETGSDGWTNGTGTVNDTAGALGRTVGQLYSRGQNADVAYVLYNDQRPAEDFGDGGAAGSSKRGGHTKGVVLLDGKQGFWLVHSTPRFPPARGEGRFSYPDSGVNNGQNFICVTYPLERFQAVGEQLQINQPNVYDCDVPESLASAVPSLAALCAPKRFPPAKTASNRSVTLTSKGGAKFISFAKGASFDHDLYRSWVAPSLGSDLLVQFWVRSAGVLPSDCSLGWKVLDVRLIRPGSTFTFKTSQDHSKWAVSPQAAGSGGGTVCLRDPAVWKAYRSAALECEACGGGAVQC